MGLRFLWVDSLCIIQDSDDDKIQELGKMASIYRGAYVTLSAGAGHQLQRRLSAHSICPARAVHRPVLLSRRQNRHRVAHIHHGASTQDIASEPVQRRAWTFQERIVSPRVVSFNRQILWFCCDSWGCDGGRVEKIQYLSMSAVPEIYQISRRMSSEMLLQPTANEWFNVVQVFSGLSITVPSDRLPALSSLAEIFALMLGDDYVAGLWRKGSSQDAELAAGGASSTTRDDDPRCGERRLGPSSPSKVGST